ncbi:oligosaccharide flippase family protein [Flavobacterium sp. 5]|uniref:oligosaccharide flippase family protein n=1 Tax=Flavobacterium sp. 5 TaxID=2035199 RepID=UPI000C2C25BE|nr:oligosaccharide flippase family protein [Flavobacterium sp. 5]PKB17426.1 Na+-driven multidrug efflux pump [Flavobacterium sp. 5]
MSTDNKKIARNTLFLYVRMFLTMGVSLYTSRIVLNALGIESYGVYSVVGGVVTLFSFFDSAMSTATQRFLAMDIGKENSENLKKTFNSALIIHIVIALLVLLIAETIGLWFVNCKLNLPVDKVDQANFVYQFSILASIIGITQVPFNALIIVKERMDVFAIISVAEVLLKLVIVFLLYISPYDKLNTYAILVFLLSLIISTVYKIYCHVNFKESSFRLYKDKGMYKELISYSGWTVFGSIAGIAKGQGINILLNLFFGTVVNAAYGITLQIQNAVYSFVTNFQMAVNPQIYKSYAQGNIDQMQKLVYQSSKFSYYLLFILVSPIIFNIDYILVWWLKNPPQYTAIFTVLTLVNLLIECISRPLITAAFATGEIKWYQIIIGGFLFLNLPISYFFFQINKDPTSFLYVAIVLSILAFFFRFGFLKKMLDLDIFNFIKKVILPVLAVSLVSIVLLYGLNLLVKRPEKLFDLLWISFIVMIINFFVISFFGCNHLERMMLLNFIKNKLNKKG